MDEMDSSTRKDISSRVKAHLQQALLHGRSNLLEQDNAFTKADFGEGIDELLQLASTRDCKLAIDCATKDVLYEIVNSDDQDSENVQLNLRTLFDLSLLLAECEVSEQTLPLSLIEEAYDTQTIDGCQKLFGYMEARFERLTTGVDGTKGKGLVLLRLSNELLRRLSKSEDTVFCGRILVFLSKSFPLSEKSGVNLRGEFNVENKTTFDTDSTLISVPTPSIEGDLEMSEASATTNQKSSYELFGESSHIDEDLDNFYSTFWSLQAYFSDPSLLFREEVLSVFKNTLATTMRLFKAMSTGQSPTAISIPNGDVQRLEKRKRPENESALDHYNPKYLTSRELFSLEVKDQVFRRHILVQSYILLDFLLTLTSEAKESWDREKMNKSLQYAFTLTDENSKWAADTKFEIVKILRSNAAMDGALFSRTVDSVLTREKNWVKWKAQNCISFEKDSVQLDQLKEVKSQANSAGRMPNSSDKDMGAASLSKIWVEERGTEGMEGLRNPKRFCPPGYRSFNKDVENAQLDLDFASDIEKEDLINTISSKTWLGLRVASKDRFHIFTKLDEDLTLKSLVTAEDLYLNERAEKPIADSKVVEEVS